MQILSPLKSSQDEEAKSGGDEITQIKKLYNQLDVDGDGTLTYEEIKDGLQRLGREDADYIYELLLNSDADGSGEIDYEEFVAVMQGKNLFGSSINEKYTQMTIINQLWEKYDDDNSGELDYDEAKNFIKEVIGDVPEEMFKYCYDLCDEDKSGAFDKLEMVDLINMLKGNMDDLSPGLLSKKIKNDALETNYFGVKSPTKPNNKRGLKKVKQVDKPTPSNSTLEEKQEQKVTLLKLKIKETMRENIENKKLEIERHEKMKRDRMKYMKETL